MKILMSPGSQPVQIEFGPKVERSCKGSLRLLPGSVRTITESEWRWIVEEHPAIAAKMKILDGSFPKVVSEKVSRPVAKPIEEKVIEEKDEVTQPPEVESPEVESPEVESPEEIKTEVAEATDSEPEEDPPPKKKRRRKKRKKSL